MKRILIVLAVLMMCVPGPARAQSPVPVEELRRTIRELSAAVRELPPNLRSRRLRDASDWLERRVQVLGSPFVRRPAPEQVSDEYLRLLQRASELLRQQPTAPVVEEVTLELEVKVEHCRRMKIGMGGTVLLKVDTLRDGVPLNNLEVQYLPKLFEHQKDAKPISFPGSSSPVEKELAPGRYNVWSRNPATGKTSDPKLLEVFGQKEVAAVLHVSFQ